MYIGVLFFYAFSMFCITFHKKWCLERFGYNNKERKVKA